MPAFFSEPAPSITTVCSNYQTSYNDFFEVYITEAVTLSPNIQMVFTESIKLLGVVLDASLTFEKHVLDVVRGSHFHISTTHHTTSDIGRRKDLRCSHRQ